MPMNFDDTKPESHQIAPIAPTRPLSHPPKRSDLPPAPQGTARQEAHKVISAPDDAIAETLALAQQKAAARLADKKEAASDRIADRLVSQTESKLDEATDFLLQALGGDWLLQSMKSSAIEAGWIDAEVIDAA